MAEPQAADPVQPFGQRDRDFTEQGNVHRIDAAAIGAVCELQAGDVGGRVECRCQAADARQPARAAFRLAIETQFLGPLIAVFVNPAHVQSGHLQGKTRQACLRRADEAVDDIGFEFGLVMLEAGHRRQACPFKVMFQGQAEMRGLGLRLRQRVEGIAGKARVVEPDAGGRLLTVAAPAAGDRHLGRVAGGGDQLARSRAVKTCPQITLHRTDGAGR